MNPAPQNPQDRPLVVGVDGGGTKSCAWLARVQAQNPTDIAWSVIGKATTGPSNPATIGVQAAARAIVQAVHQARDQAMVHQQPIASLAAGIAGTGDPKRRDALTAELIRHGLAQRVHVTDDVSPAWRAAQAQLQAQHFKPNYPAVVLASGTGSLAWGIDQAGNTARAGGLGPAQGDPGSAYAIGLAALRAGLDLPTIRQYKLSHPFDASDVAAIAKLAQAVIEQADLLPGARDILDRAADDLAALAQSVAIKLSASASQPVTLVVTGSLLTRCDLLLNSVRARLQRRGIEAQPIIQIIEPVTGSVYRAIDELSK